MRISDQTKKYNGLIFYKIKHGEIMQERKASWRRWTMTRFRRNYPTWFDQQEEET